MREMALRMLVGVVVCAGCFQPTVTSGSFLCDPGDETPCPSGFYCVHGRCFDNPSGNGTNPGDDLAGGVGGGGVRDLAASGGDDLGMASGDLASTTPPDLAQPADLAKPRDLAPAPDLATGMCGHAGAPCTTIDECCSMYCRSDGICIGG